MQAVTALFSIGIFAFIGHTGLICTGVYLGVAIVLLWPGMRILSQAGYPQWWALAILLPIVGLVLLYLFALREWPVRRELSRLRAKSRNQRNTYVEYRPQSGPPVQYGHHN